MRHVTIIFTLFIALSVKAQHVCGHVIDGDTGRPLSGVAVSVPELNVLTENDSIGFWELKIPAGTYSVCFRLLGYETVVVPDVFVSSRKRRNLSVSMKESTTVLDEVTITSDTRDYGRISGIRINPSELAHIPGHANDPVRMLTLMPGINNTGDDRNDLVVRGNSSIGVLWRIEGIEVFNPNHYASSGASGGVVSSLNKDILGTSYFYTGAFPSEFGNVFSGVFDASFREGNANEYEFSAEASNLDVNLIVEGPVPTKNRKSSFVAAFRQSVIPLFDVINKKYRELLGATPTLSDFSFKLASRDKVGAKTVLWGLAGKSDIEIPVADANPVAISNHTVNASAGLSRQFFVGEKTNVKATLGASYLKTDNANELTNDNRYYLNHLVDKSKSIGAGLLFDVKANGRNVLRGGANVRLASLELLKNQNIKLSRYRISKTYCTTNAFAEWKAHFGRRLSVASGIHFFLFSLNDKYSLEPRVSATYSLDNHRLELAMGEYSRQNPVGIYMSQIYDSVKNIAYPNRNIGFVRSRQAVLSFGGKLLRDISFKTELYGQYHYNVAIAKQVEYENDLFLSALNLSYDAADIEQSGVLFDNTGKGYSAGMEGMIYFDEINGFSANLSGSLFKSMYRCRKGWYNTLFDAGFTFKSLFGKKFKLSDRVTLQTYLSANWLGGRRYTPIDCDLSHYSFYPAEDYSRYASKQYSDYFRMDIKTSLIVDGKSSSHVITLDIRNLTDHKNVYYQGYYLKDGRMENYAINQLQIFPVVSYKLLFGGKS
ncbi:MAG: carboxypeptidase-like regulatory domain-containing protein [Prevotellaceae bacterium]|jgi:hypothetical protein|nr:carboxypeptidase-like regulatory domain-containing protein [Prevotellaceae bacterium]